MKVQQMTYDFRISFDATYGFEVGKIQMYSGIVANQGLYNVAARFLGLTEYTRGYFIQVGIKLPR